ncbi:hypothetical protein GCM10027169_26780 [Gordonia jinhuaensis]|uniref:DUF7144 domain-containing protein n=1 Tax=Gordonia jinhuaensis TaxID=1517702 RepID=A0A916TAB1_9ACTN|nr:hypothetical protein [Gordonia jinhuaensis]GGB37519.1 hypothetical protein GCM10011489_26650 [Gordonia jinhuaensis]
MASRHDPAKQGLAGGTVFLAAILLLTASILALLEGISAAANDKLIIVDNDYVYKFSTTSWGWIHIILGIIGIAISFGIFAGRVWARTCGIILACLSIIANFLWLPYYTWWALLLILIDLFAIWALSTWDPYDDVI